MPKNEPPERIVEYWLGGSADRTVVEVLATVSREIAAPSSQGFGESVSQLVLELEQLRTVSQGQADAVTENTEAVIQNTVAQVTSGRESAAAKVGKAAKTIFGSALGLSPLVTGLVRLFAGGEGETPPPLVSYSRPPAIYFEGAVVRSPSPSGYRVEREWEERPEPVFEREPRREGVNVNIQVQAIDSRSFLDHSEEIARAVREAMLNSHSLNDVVSDL